MRHKPTPQENWQAEALATLPEDLRELHLADLSRGMMPTDWLRLLDRVEELREAGPG